MPDLNKIMPFVLLWIPWCMAVREIVRHIQHGEMREYLRRSSEDDRDGTQRTTLAKHPISYRLLLLFYGAVSVAIPALTAYVLLNS